MSIIKRIVLLSTQLCLVMPCFCQREKIDSLKRELPSLRDSARVDCLNELSGAFLKLEKVPTEWKDINIAATAGYYAASAYEEAKKINYTHGIAESLSYKGEIERLSNNFPQLEKICHEAIEWYRDAPNKKRLAETYYNLGFALYAQSMFTEAIKNLDTSYQLYEKNNNTREMCKVNTTAAVVYEESGNYEKAFELARKGLKLATENNDDWLRRTLLSIIGSLFEDIQDYPTGLAYCFQATQNLKPNEYNNFNPRLLRVIAELYSQQKQFDSAKYYYSFFDTTNERGLRFYLVSFGECYLLQKEYKEALPNFIRGLDYHKRLNDRNWVMRTLLDIAKTYLALRNNDSAFKYANESLNIAMQSGAKQVIRDASEILSSIYDHWRHSDSAYFYYRQFTTMKDSVLNNVIKGRLAAYTFEQKMELLNKEKRIQQAQLQKESLWRKFLVIGIIVLMFLAIIIVRIIMLKRKNETNKRALAENELQLQELESERTKAEFQHQTTELEMQALRAQMNPHFIFNSLNSINRFILQNNRSQASEYLTKFSRLVRLILQNSQATVITLQSELESLALYLEMEALRFDYHFAYKIAVPGDLDVEVLKVPSLIIQPYVENAIWHGLMHKEEKGQLDIKVSEVSNHLFFKIRDDGIGRKQATALASKSTTRHKSMGLRITADRIAMMQRSNGTESPVTINDLVNADSSAAGTEVIIKIPVMYD